MKQFLRKWLGIEDKTEEKPQEASYFLVNRHYLQSINIEDLDEYLTSMSESERKEYEAEASLIFTNKAFQREIKHLLGEQALFIANQSGNWEQVILGRGTVNGVGLIDDRFKLLYSRHLDNIKMQAGM